MSQVAPDQSQSRRHNTWMTFVISLSAAVCMAGGFAIMGVAFVFASAVLFDLSQALAWTVHGIIGIASLWGLSGSLAAPGMWKKDLGAGSRSMTPKLIENWRE